jgi:oleate hydratase
MDLSLSPSPVNAHRRAHLVGGGIGSLAAAAFMIRDGHLPGRNITIYEASSVLGGSLDGAGNPVEGYRLRGGRMFTTDNYECTWDLFKSVPSLTNPSLTVYEETVAFNTEHVSHASARLVDKNRHAPDLTRLGFSMDDRLQLLKIFETSEETLGADRITDWLSPAFLETPFWFMWQTTFAFQPWHSAVEFKRYLHRFMLEFTRIETLSGVKRTVFNQYDSMVRPLVSWLEGQGVHFRTHCLVTDIDLTDGPEKRSVTGFSCLSGGKVETVEVGREDIVFLQNGSMTDASSFGTMSEPPAKLGKWASSSWALWEKLAARNPDFGNPAAFNSTIPESLWTSFTVTLADPAFFDAMQAFSGNVAGTGGLVTFKDSAWLMSIVLAHQPHFAGQPAGTQVFWGYGLHPGRVGNFVPKSMSDCTGFDILQELCGHLNFDPEIVRSAHCLPCRMPYITSMFMPRRRTDRPLPVPETSQNLAFVSQFVEIADDVVFTVEYSVRAAMIAVYQLLDVQRPVVPIRHHDRSLKVELQSVLKAMA